MPIAVDCRSMCRYLQGIVNERGKTICINCCLLKVWLIDGAASLQLRKSPRKINPLSIDLARSWSGWGGRGHRHCVRRGTWQNGRWPSRHRNQSHNNLRQEVEGQGLRGGGLATIMTWRASPDAGTNGAQSGRHQDFSGCLSVADPLKKRDTIFRSFREASRYYVLEYIIVVCCT